jgi:hypothetical protein
MAGGSEDKEEEESGSSAAMVCDVGGGDAMVGDRVYGEINMDGVVVQLRPDSVSRAYR